MYVPIRHFLNIYKKYCQLQFVTNVLTKVTKVFKNVQTKKDLLVHFLLATTYYFLQLER
jgi:hypothetical protein